MVVALEERAIPLSEGTYTNVGLDADSTGFRLIDKIVHIAAYTSTEDFSQHVIITNDGIIFVYHDQHKFIPYILIEAFNKYNLMDRLMKTVKSFVNGFDLAEEKTANTIKYLTLSQEKFGKSCI